MVLKVALENWLVGEAYSPVIILGSEDAGNGQ